VSSARKLTPDGWRTAAKSLAAALFLFFVVLQATGDGAPPMDVRTANDLYHAGQYRQAVEMLDQLLAPGGAAKFSEPVLISALQLAVDVNRASSRFDVALKYAQQWEQLLDREATASGRNLNAQLQAALLAVADLQMSLEQPKEAEAYLQQALALPDGARLSDPVWKADVQVRLARAQAAQADSNRKESVTQRAGKPAGIVQSDIEQRAKRQWMTAETAAQEAVEHCQQAKLPMAQLVAAKLQVECLLAQDRAEEAAAMIDRLLGDERDRDEPARIELAGELAQCRHALHDSVGEGEALKQALAWQEQADRNQSTVVQAGLLNRIALAAVARDDNATAEQEWKAAANIYQQVLDQFAAPANHAAANPETQFVDLQCLQGLQEIDLRLGDWTGGVQVSRRLVERLEPRLLKDDPALVRAKTTLAAFLAKTEDWNDAKPLLAEAAKFWRSRVPPAPADLAGVLVNLAEIARQTSNFAEAQSLLEEALAANRKALGPDDIKLAETLSNLAAVQNARGQFAEALANFQDAEEICRKPANVNNRRAEELLGATLLNLSMLYKSQRQFEPAAAVCEQALALAQKRHPSETDAALLPFHIALASLYLAEDVAAPEEPNGPAPLSQESNGTFQAGAPLSAVTQQADVHIQAAMNICTQRQLMKKSVAANVLHLAATLQYRRGELDAAKKTWQDALEIAQRTEQTAVAFRCLSYLGQVAVKEGNLDEADTLSQQAVNLQEIVQAYPAMHYMALVNRAQVLRKLGRKDKALDCLYEAVSVIESPRAETTGGEARRAEYFAQFGAAFDLLVDWSVEEGRWDDALSYAEAGRNRTFLDQIRAAGVDLRESLRGTPQEHLLADEQQILSQYHTLQTKAIERLNSQTESSAAKSDTTDLAHRLTDLRRRYADIQTAIRDASPFYREVLLGNRGLQTWSVIKPHVLSRDSMMVFYYLGQNDGHLFVIDSGAANGGESTNNDNANGNSEVTHYPLVVTEEQSSRLGIPPGPLTRQSAARLVLRYVATLCASEQTRKPGRSLGTSAVVSSKYAVGPNEMVMISDILMPRKVREELRHGSPQYITVVPDGALHQLPLESLCVSNDPPRYLLDELPPIAYAPSAMILAALEQRKATGSGKDLSLLSVGNPSYPEVEPAVNRSASDVALADYLAAGGTLSPLPGTSSECRKVAGAMRSAGMSDVEVLQDVNASERNVRQQVAGRKFIHLAAHGLVDQQYQNLFGAIALTQPEDFQNTTTENDGFLSLFEIHGLPLGSCELVILSACQTNVGPDRPLEAGSTMARAFLAAGARRVVCSQWDVDDESTAELMGAFAAAIGQSLRTGEAPNYAMALDQARKYVRGQPKWSSPYHWAPFVLMGPAR